MTEPSSEAGPPQSFIKKLFSPKGRDHVPSGLTQPDNLAPEEGIDRRQFLIDSLITLLAWKLSRNKFVTRAVGALPALQGKGQQSPDVTSTAAKLPKRLEVNENFAFEKFTYVDRDGKNDSMDVLGVSLPLSPADMDYYIRSRESSKLPPTNTRVAEIFIGSKAWNIWNHGASSRETPQEDQPAGGEHILSFIKRHFVYGIEGKLRKTRPESRINTALMEEVPRHTTKVVIVDEQWLKDHPYGKYGGITSSTSSADVWARYYIPEPYKPMLNEANDFTDYVIFHEMVHFTLGVHTHLPNFFLDLENWREYPVMPGGIDSKEVKLWNLAEMRRQMFAFQLQSLQNEDPNTSPFSQVEELFINRTLRSSRHIPVEAGDYRTVSPTKFDFGEADGELASRYEIDIGQNLDENNQWSAKLYSARRGPVSGFANAVWDFDVEPMECDIVEGKVQLPHNQLLGGIREANDGSVETNDPKVFLLVLENGDNKREVLGFTSYHLMHWHYLEQIAQGDVEFGASGGWYPVTVKLGEFE